MGTLPHAVRAVVSGQAQQFWTSDLLPKGTPAGVGRRGRLIIVYLQSLQLQQKAEMGNSIQ